MNNNKPTKDIKKHEDNYLHIQKRTIGIIFFFLISFGSWGYLVYELTKYPELNRWDIVIPFVILFFVITAAVLFSILIEVE